MKGYLYLFIKSNKNYFFERFKIFNSSGFDNIYYVYFFSKGIFITLFTYLLTIILKTNESIIVLIPLFVYIFKIFGIDSTKWVHYYRDDWLVSYPNEIKRFKEILIGNICVDFIFEDNIFFVIILQSYFYDLKILILIYVAILLIYILTMSFQLVIIQSDLFLKKIYSLIIYSLSSLITYYTVYVVIKSAIKFINIIVQKKDILGSVVSSIVIYINDVLLVIYKYGNLLMLFLLVISFLNMICIIYTMSVGYFQNGLQNKGARIADLKIVKKYVTMIDILKFKHPEMLKKELALIVELYSFRYKEYFNTFFIDRSGYIILALLMNLYENYKNNLEIAIVSSIALIFYLDINSGMCAKLLANMSFASDYSIISISKSTNLSIKELVDLKYKLFQLIRFPSLIFYLLLSFTIFYMFRISIGVFIALLSVIIIFWIVLPKIFFTNNLIYTRQDYTNFSKYIEEINILTSKSKDFFIIELYYKLLVFWVIITIFVGITIQNIFIVRTVFYSSVAITIIILIIVNFIMRIIRENIISSIEEGDYSVDVAKIF